MQKHTLLIATMVLVGGCQKHDAGNAGNSNVTSHTKNVAQKEDGHTITKFAEQPARMVGHSGTTEFQVSNVQSGDPPTFTYSPTGLLAGQKSDSGATPDLSILTGAPKPGASGTSSTGSISVTVTATFQSEPTPTSQAFNLAVAMGVVDKSFTEITPDGKKIITYQNADLRQPDISTYSTTDAQYASLKLGLQGFNETGKYDLKLSWNGGYHTFLQKDPNNCVLELSECEAIMPNLSSVNIFVFECPTDSKMTSWHSRMK